MNNSQFDEIVERRGTNCAKWDTFDVLLGGEKDLIHVGCADMDFKAPEPILKEFHRLADHGVFGYSDIFDDFYSAIERFYRHHHNVAIKHEHMVFCPRINIGCGLVAEAFTRPYEEVLIHSPSYGPLRQAIEENGRKLVEVPLRYDGVEYSLNIADLEQAVTKRTKMLILVNPHNPTTRVFTKTELEQIAQFCLDHDLILFADEIHSDLLAKDVTFTSVLELDEKYQKNIILASSPAKTFNIPGLVGSFMIISNDKLRARVADEISRIGEHNPNVFFNAALIAAYTKCDDYIASLRCYLDDNEAYLRKEFATLFPKSHIIKRDGSYLLWIDLSKCFTSEEQIREFFVTKARVGIYFGSQFSKDCSLFIRFNMAAPRKVLEEVMSRLNKVKQSSQRSWLRQHRLRLLRWERSSRQRLAAYSLLAACLQSKQASRQARS